MAQLNHLKSGVASIVRCAPRAGVRTSWYGAVLVLLVLAGCDGSEENARIAGDGAAQPAAAAGALLVNRVWTQTQTARELPGVMRIFLSDGTLVQDSCWETYRLSAWRMLADGQVEWSEDGRSITADLVAVDERALVLRLHLVGGDEEQSYVAAAVPFLCPDMPR